MRRILPTLLVLLSITATLPLVAAQAPSPVGASGPDAEGAWALLYDVTRASAGHADARLDVSRTDNGQTVHATRALSLDLPAGASRVNVSFLPAEGPGDYAVALVLDGESSAPLLFHAEGSAGGSAHVSFEVADEPTYLNITSDSVNADGKLKNAGDDVITRATLHDGNGLADIDAALRWSVDGFGFHDEGALALPTSPTTTDVSIEHRWNASPLANETYRLTLSATRSGAVVANASRTFVIKDAPSTLSPLTLANVTPDADTTFTADVLLADRNGAPAPGGVLEARLLRGTTRATDLGATFANGLNTTDTSAGTARGRADGAGLTAFPVTVRVPAGTPAGAVKLSILLDGTTLGSATFNVSALPTLSSVVATQVGDSLVVNATGSGNGVVHVELRAGEAAAAQDVALVNGSASARLAALPGASTMHWNATLLARAGGAPLASREGDWARATPNVSLVLVHGLPRLPATFDVLAPGWDLRNATALAGFTRWDGATERNLTGRFDGASLVVDGPASLPAGRYTMTLTVTFANGTAASVNTTLDAGPWVRMSLGAPSVAGREARLSLANEGGVTVRRLVVELDGNATLTLVVNGTTYAPHASASGRLLFEGIALAPGDVSTLVARLPDGPLASGARDVSIRVLALPGGA